MQSWTNLFNRNVVTASQVLMNMRSLILLDYPLETVKKLLEAKLESLDTLKILKLRQFLAVIFDQELLRVVPFLSVTNLQLLPPALLLTLIITLGGGAA